MFLPAELPLGAIDLGCGPHGILDLLAGRVSPGGRVVGLDADPAHTVMAAEFVSAHGLSGVAIVTADARRSMRPQIVQLGLADEKELDALDAAARAHIDDPRTIVMSGLLFLVWGRKSA